MIPTPPDDVTRLWSYESHRFYGWCINGECRYQWAYTSTTPIGYCPVCNAAAFTETADEAMRRCAQSGPVG